jgi:Flp pilus assembly protein TadG
MLGEIRISSFCPSRIRRNLHAIVRFDSRGDNGQALVEFVVVIPMLFLLIVLAMNFGGLINAWINVENATRAAADYAIMSGDSAGNPTTATSTTLQNLINAEMAALPNLSSSNPNACVRENDNGTFTTLVEMPAGACSSYANPTSDTEVIVSGSTVTYATVAVDITYTYTSFFSGNSVMGLPLTVLPSTVHRRTVMRIE